VNQFYTPELNLSFLSTVCLRFLMNCLILIQYVLIKWMVKITEKEFGRICEGIKTDREIICKHNPIGTTEEILLWMLLSCLTSYLSLSEIETPCFNGKPDAETYRNAILYVLKDRKAADFDAEKYINELTEK